MGEIGRRRAGPELRCPEGRRFALACFQYMNKSVDRLCADCPAGLKEGNQVAYVAADERKRQLIEATVRVVEKYGVARASTRLIAREAGTNLGALHYVFGTKEELFASVMLETLNFSEAGEFSRLVPPRSGLRQAVTVILQEFRISVTEHSDLALAQYEMLFWSLRSSESSHLAKRVYDLYIETLGALLASAAGPREQSVDTRVLARYVLMIVDGFYLQWLTMRECMTDDELPATADALLGMARKLPRVRTVASEASGGDDTELHPASPLSTLA
jgi:AcrR family transcriptional regulator